MTTNERMNGMKWNGMERHETKRTKKKRIGSGMNNESANDNNDDNEAKGKINYGEEEKYDEKTHKVYTKMP